MMDEEYQGTSSATCRSKCKLIIDNFRTDRGIQPSPDNEFFGDTGENRSYRNRPKIRQKLRLGDLRDRSNNRAFPLIGDDTS